MEKAIYTIVTLFSLGYLTKLQELLELLEDEDYLGMIVAAGATIKYNYSKHYEDYLFYIGMGMVDEIAWLREETSKVQPEDLADIVALVARLNHPINTSTATLT